jgi:hypothetical protein
MSADKPVMDGSWSRWRQHAHHLVDRLSNTERTLQERLEASKELTVMVGGNQRVFQQLIYAECGKHDYQTIGGQPGSFEARCTKCGKSYD